MSIKKQKNPSKAKKQLSKKELSKVSGGVMAIAPSGSGGTK